MSTGRATESLVTLLRLPISSQYQLKAAYSTRALTAPHALFVHMFLGMELLGSRHRSPDAGSSCNLSSTD